MLSKKILAKLEKYSPWIRINRKLAGPVLILSVAYILVFLVTTFYLLAIGFQMSNIQQTLYFIGFGLFVISIYLTFIGLMLRSIK